VSTLSQYRRLAGLLAREAAAVYGDRLVSVVVYGSVARGVPTPDSDLDLLVVADGLPSGRIAQLREFKPVEERLGPALKEMAAEGIRPFVSPVFKTREQVEYGSPLFLDMTLHADILFDRGGFFAARLDRLRARLTELGSKRVPCRGGYYWVLKPDLKPGEVIEL